MKKETIDLMDRFSLVTKSACYADYGPTKNRRIIVQLLRKDEENTFQITNNFEGCVGEETDDVIVEMSGELEGGYKGGSLLSDCWISLSSTSIDYIHDDGLMEKLQDIMFEIRERERGLRGSGNDPYDREKPCDPELEALRQKQIDFMRENDPLFISESDALRFFLMIFEDAILPEIPPVFGTIKKVEIESERYADCFREFGWSINKNENIAVKEF